MGFVLYESWRCVSQELIEKYDVSVLPTFVAFKGGDKVSEWYLAV